jgi:hypothetical protein
MLFNERKLIVDLATKHRLPSMSNAREFAELGGLIAYGASLTDLQRRSATYVDKILKGGPRLRWLKIGCGGNVRVTLYDLQPSALTTEGVSYDSPPPCVAGIGDINSSVLRPK